MSSSSRNSGNSSPSSARYVSTWKLKHSCWSRSFKDWGCLRDFSTSMWLTGLPAAWSSPRFAGDAGLPLADPSCWTVWSELVPVPTRGVSGCWLKAPCILSHRSNATSSCSPTLVGVEHGGWPLRTAVVRLTLLLLADVALSLCSSWFSAPNIPLDREEIPGSGSFLRCWYRLRNPSRPSALAGPEDLARRVSAWPRWCLLRRRPSLLFQPLAQGWLLSLRPLLRLVCPQGVLPARFLLQYYPWATAGFGARDLRCTGSVVGSGCAGSCCAVVCMGSCCAGSGCVGSGGTGSCN